MCTLAAGRGGAIPRQADSDEQAIAVWLHGRGDNPHDGYRRDVARFFAHVASPIAAIMLADGR